MFGIKSKIKKMIFKYTWKKRNVHNYTIAGSIFKPDQVIVGNKTYGVLNINLGTNPKRNVRIGNFCSIAPDVSFVINPHNYKFFSSWGWQIFAYHERNYTWEEKTTIIVEDDVWIGQGATILGGAILRQGCVIGANTVVNKEIPAYAIYAGNKIIKYRFSTEVCQKLERIDYSKFNENVINNLYGWHQKEIDESNIGEFISIVPLKD